MRRAAVSRASRFHTTRPGRVSTSLWSAAPLRVSAGDEESLKGSHRLSSPIVTKDKLVEVDGKLGSAHTVVGADQPLLEIPNSSIGQGHYRFAAARLRPGHVLIPHGLEPGERLQAIGTDGRTWSDLAAEEALDRGGPEVEGNHLHADAAGAVAALFNGHQDEGRPPAFELAASAQPRLRAADPGLVDLDRARLIEEATSADQGDADPSEEPGRGSKREATLAEAIDRKGCPSRAQRGHGARTG